MDTKRFSFFTAIAIGLLCGLLCAGMLSPITGLIERASLRRNMIQIAMRNRAQNAQNEWMRGLMVAQSTKEVARLQLQLMYVNNPQLIAATVPWRGVLYVEDLQRKKAL